MAATGSIPAIIRENQDQLLAGWVEALEHSAARRPDLISAQQVRAEAGEFLTLLCTALAAGMDGDLRGAEWDDVRSMLARLSRSRAIAGFTPSETISFVLSFKQPLFELLAHTNADTANAQTAIDDAWQANQLLDTLGLHVSETYQADREQVIHRQQHEMLELSTPVVRLWEGVLAVPLIGTLDSARTQVVMESLLEMIDQTNSTMAVVDITGVPTVDTLVAQHLLKTAAAARLMGAEVIISGIRPQIAQTVVQLGVEMPDVTTKASMADAFALALDRLGYTVTRRGRE